MPHEADRAYLAEHGVAAALADAIAKILVDKPANPFAAMSDFLQQRADEHSISPESVFAKYDVNGDGVLQTDEWNRVVSDLSGGQAMTEEQSKALMEVVDSDQNGTVGLVELKSFMRMWRTPTKTMRTKSALIIIDVQNDFISGTLGNSDPTTKSIVPLINELREAMDVVVVSYDWHPHDHCSFVESANAGATPIKSPPNPYDPFTLVTLEADATRPEHQQLVYARHCVQGSWGSECHPDLVVKESDGKIYKGQKPNIDSYSAFYDNLKVNDCGLRALLEAEGVTHCYCVGLCFDICVKCTALHGAELGFQVVVVEDACRPLMLSEVAPTKAAFAAAGVKVASTAEAIAMAKATQGKELSLAEYVAMAQSMKGAQKLSNVTIDQPEARAMFVKPE